MDLGAKTLAALPNLKRMTPCLWASISSMVLGRTPQPSNPPRDNLVTDEPQSFEETLKFIGKDKIPAKKAAHLIQQHVREDWKWPDPPSPVDARSINGKAPDASAREGNTVYRRREVIEDFDQISSRSSDTDDVGRTLEGVRKGYEDLQSMSSMDIADLTLDGRLLLQGHEMGISIFEARRDAWTGAVRMSASGDQKENPCSRIPHRNIRDPDKPGSLGDYSSETSQTLLPVPPYWLPDHETRIQSRREENYADIYTKFVASSTKANLPINLRDVVRSCVVGWKLDGTWAQAENQGLIQADAKPADPPETGRGKRVAQRPKEAIKKSVAGVKDGVVNTVKSKVGNLGASRGSEKG